MFTAADFFNKLYGNNRHKIFFRGIHKTDVTLSLYNDFNSVRDALIYENKKKHNIYYIVNETDGGASDENVVASFALFIDIDEGALPEHFPLEPSSIVSRADDLGHHVYWFIERTEDLENWKAAQLILIGFYKSDKVIHNPARLMRVPGSMNFKKDPLKYDIKILNDNRYTLSEVVAAHSDKKLIQKAYEAKLKGIFKEKLKDGDGRHAAMIQAVFLMHDFKFVKIEIEEELRRINDKYLEDKYPEEELKKFADAKRYAKNEEGKGASDTALEEQKKRDKIKELLDHWYYVYKGDYFINLDDIEYDRDRNGFNAQFAKVTETNNSAQYVFKYDLIKTAEQPVYTPNEQTIIVDAKGNRTINLWTPPKITAKDGPTKWFTDHLEYLFHEEAERKAIIDFLAHIVQKPEKKIMHAILMIGKPGVGKSFFYEICKKIYGETNVTSPHNENLQDKYTAWAKHCQLCFIHEINQSDRRDFLNKIKPFITERDIEIREMYRTPYKIKNHMHIFAVSNFDSPILLDQYDRRWVVLKTNAEKRAPSYYERLFKSAEKHCDALLDFLEKWDLTGFEPYAEPAMTEAKRYIIDQSKSDLEVWISEQMEQGVAPFDRTLLTIEDIMDSSFLPPKFKHDKFTTLNRVSRTMASLGAISLPRMRVGNKRVVLWAIKDIERIEAAMKIGCLKELINEEYKAQGITLVNDDDISVN